MPKKKTSKKKNKPSGSLGSSSNSSRTPRKQDYNTRRVGAIVERLRDQATRLSGLAKNMDEAGIDQVIVDGHAMLMRGLNQIDNFADNATRAVREAKNELEDL